LLETDVNTPDFSVRKKFRFYRAKAERGIIMARNPVTGKEVLACPM